MKIREIRDQLYERKIRFITGNDAELARWCSQHQKDWPWNEHCYGRYFSIDGIHYVMVGNRMAKTKRAATLAHEVFHLAASVMDSVGIGLCGKSDEAWAYWIDKIYEQCFKHL